MDVTLFKQKKDALKAKNDEIAKFWNDRDAQISAKKAADPNFNDLEVSADDRKTLDRLFGEVKDLSAEVESFKEFESISERAQAILDVFDKPVHRPDFGGKADRQPNMKTAGQAFVESKQYKDLMKYLQPEGPTSGPISEELKIAGYSQPFAIGDYFNLKGLVFSSSTSGGAFVRREYAENEVLPLRPLTIRQLITNLRTGSNLIEYVRQTAKTRAADVIPEATATSGGGYTAAAKPEASMAWEVVQEGVKTIPVHMPITRQILADAPQLEGEINTFLVDDCELKLEEEIVTGAGGTHFTGIENTAGITPQAFFNDGVNQASSMIATARKALTTCNIVARDVATGFLMNPLDWETFDLAKDGQNRYYWGGPLILGVKTLWGRPVAESEVIYQGTAWTGNLKKIVVWDRELPTLRMTDSHADEFTHNIIRILVELRAAMGVKRPAALVKIDFLQGANS